MALATLDMLGTGLIVTYVSLAISMGLTIYTVYLNWKQAKVNNQMDKVINVLEQIRDGLKRKK